MEEEARTSWANHDIGILMSRQSPTIHHFQRSRVIIRHEEVQGSQVVAGLGRRPFRPRSYYSLPNPIKEYGMKHLAKLL
jgi:hypothetical protein